MSDPGVFRLSPELTAVLLNSPLFHNLGAATLARLFERLQLRERHYARETVVLAQGDFIDGIGLLTDGSCRVEQSDVWGNRQIIGLFRRGELFGEVFALLPQVPLRVSAVAGEQGCRCVFIRPAELLAPDLESDFRTVLLQNFLQMMAVKNLLLTRKNELLSERTIRRKLLKYFSELSAASGSAVIELPFSRTALADYLCVDRSALSKELSALQREGLIEADRRRIRLHI